MRDVLVDLLTLPMPILWLLVLALVLWRWKGLSRAVFLVGALLFLALSLPASGRLLVWSLQAGTPVFAGKVPDGTSAILVPTAGTSDDGTGRWWPGAASIVRLATALRLQERWDLPIILSGGSVESNQPPEAETLAAHFGLQGPDIRLETQARNSSETAEAVVAMLAGEPNPRVILVTSATHVARMSAVLRHHGVAVTAAVAAGGDAGPWAPSDFLPSYQGLMMSRGAFQEYMGILWYLATDRLDFEDL